MTKLKTINGDLASSVQRSSAASGHLGSFKMEAISQIKVDTSCPYLIRDLMPNRGVLVLYGQPGTGKSFLALDAALHVAAGKDWAGREVKQAGVVYIASEGGHGFRKRIVASVRDRHIPKSVPFGLITDAPKLGNADCELDGLMDAIERQAEVLGTSPKLIVIDTLACCLHDLDESSSTDMGTFIRNAKTLGDKFDALIMLVHHSGKDEDKGMRGSSALKGAIDAAWHVKKEPDGLLFNVEKMKDGQSGFDYRFHLSRAELEEDISGTMITTLTVSFPDDPLLTGTPEDRAKRKILNRYKTLHRITKAIVEAGTTGGERPEGPDANVKAMILSDLVKLIGTDDAGKVDKTVYRDIKELVAEDALHKSGDWFWLP